MSMIHDAVFVRRGDERVTELTRDFSASRSKVFQAWTTAASLEQWWGPHFVSITQCHFEARSGGSYRIEMTGEEDQRYPMYGLVREYVANERLAWQVCLDEHPESWVGIFRPRGTHLEHAIMEWEYEITFQDIPGGTRVTIASTYPAEEDILTMLAAGATVGWGESFEKLDRLLATSGADKRSH